MTGNVRDSLELGRIANRISWYAHLACMTGDPPSVVSAVHWLGGIPAATRMVAPATDPGVAKIDSACRDMAQWLQRTIHSSAWHEYLSTLAETIGDEIAQGGDENGARQAAHRRLSEDVQRQLAPILDAVMAHFAPSDHLMFCLGQHADQLLRPAEPWRWVFVPPSAHASPPPPVSWYGSGPPIQEPMLWLPGEVLANYVPLAGERGIDLAAIDIVNAVVTQIQQLQGILAPPPRLLRPSIAVTAAYFAAQINAFLAILLGWLAAGVSTAANAIPPSLPHFASPSLDTLVGPPATAQILAPPPPIMPSPVTRRTPACQEPLPSAQAIGQNPASPPVIPAPTHTGDIVKGTAAAGEAHGTTAQGLAQTAKDPAEQARETLNSRSLQEGDAMDRESMAILTVLGNAKHRLMLQIDIAEATVASLEAVMNSARTSGSC